MKTIAVYGSLKQGKHNHGMIASGKYVGRSNRTGHMYLISTYPAFIPADDGLNHHFELYEVDDDTYQRVRGMEISAGYNEETAEFEMRGSGEIVEALFYPAGEFLRNHCIESRPMIPGY